MADITKFDLTEGGYDTTTTSEAQAAAATLTIDYTSSKRVLLYVNNADAAVDAYLRFEEPTNGGERKLLGDYTVEVPHGDEAVIDLADTARLLNLTDTDIDVSLVDSAGEALAAEILSDITLRAINL